VSSADYHLGHGRRRRAIRQRAATVIANRDERGGDSLVTVDIVGRLENIIARNQRPKGSRERLVVTVGFGMAILIILALMVFTDLGMPPVPRKAVPVESGAAPGASAAPATGAERRGKRVDGVLLRSPPPAQPQR
jgi:hypothetical protein